MNTSIETLLQFCRKLKGGTKNIKWEDHLCFKVGGKMFLIIAPNLVPSMALIKVSAEEIEELSAKPGFLPAQYQVRYKWV